MFQVFKQGAIDVIGGELPLIGENLDALTEAFDSCLAAGQPKAVLNLESIPLMDSEGLERLLDLRDQFEQRAGTLKLAAANPLCADILAVTGVGSYFEMHAEVKQALGSFIR